MPPIRRPARALAVGLLMASTVACGAGVTRSAATSTTGPAPTTTVSPAPTTTVSPATTTTTPPTTAPPPPTTVPPTTVPPPPAEPDVLEQGVGGSRTLVLQQRLVELHLDPGPLDGEFGTRTLMAVWAFQKVAGLTADGRVTPELWQAMLGAGEPAPMRPDGPLDRIEIDVTRQVLFVYQGGELRLMTHVSTGSGVQYCENGSCGDAITPTGEYTVYRRIDGWRESALGRLYNPLYFTGGLAIHGAASVPDHPASHGCVRIPMHIAEYLPGIVANGEAVYLQ